MDPLADPNNNTPGEKAYSLRPRALARRDSEPAEPEPDDWRPRGRAKRRAKQKSAPLSKYRRKTANARERSRMREINEAFETLRRALPHCGPAEDASAEKTTKIMTLRLAMKYIAALGSALRRADDSDAESLASDASRELSLTPSSLSEHSEFDQLFGLPETVLAPFLGEPRAPLDRPKGRTPQRPPPGLPPFGLLTAAAPPPPPPSAPSPVPPPPPAYATPPWREFDCLPPSPMNLDELFLT